MKQDLKKENEDLKKKLAIAQNWMKKEIEADGMNIAKNKEREKSLNNRKKHLHDNVEDIVINSIYQFFGDIIYASTPEYVLKNIISAEVLYYNQCHYKFVDGLGVITSYQKAIDYLIEENITKPFRKFSIKNNQNDLKRNDLIEKSLDLVVNKGYILSVGKLYSLIYAIKNDEILYEYGNTFKLFLQEYKYIKDIILSEDFFILLKEIIDSELFGEKRHNGIVSFEETKFARKILIGDLKDQNCLIYKLIKIEEIDF